MTHNVHSHFKWEKWEHSKETLDQSETSIQQDKHQILSTFSVQIFNFKGYRLVLCFKLATCNIHPFQVCLTPCVQLSLADVSWPWPWPYLGISTETHAFLLLYAKDSEVLPYSKKLLRTDTHCWPHWLSETTEEESLTSFLILVCFNGSKASSMCMILPSLTVPAWDVSWPTLTTAAFYVETSAISLVLLLSQAGSLTVGSCSSAHFPLFKKEQEEFLQWLQSP